MGRENPTAVWCYALYGSALRDQRHGRRLPLQRLFWAEKQNELNGLI